MSTVKANNHQIGQSGTATNNFTLYQPSTPDGTVRLAVGNSGATTGDVLSVSNTGLSVTGTLSATGNVTLSGGTANGVLYLNGSKVATSGSALTFDGTNLGVGVASPTLRIQAAVSGATNTFDGLQVTNGTATYRLGTTGATYSYAGVGANEVWLYAAGATPLSLGPDGNAPIKFVTNGSERMRLDSSGNLGLGVTPSAWDSGSKAFQISSHAVFAAYTSGSNQQALLLNNAYLSATGYKYLNSNYATYYQQQASAGTHAWFTAASGTAGNAITFTQALTLDANRNLLLNGTSAGTSAVGTLTIFNGTAPTASVTDGIILYAQDVSSSSELKVRDEAGNVTTLSPHNFSLIPDGPSEDMAWAYYSEKSGKRINVDMLKLARMVEKLTGEKLVYES